MPSEQDRDRSGHRVVVTGRDSTLVEGVLHVSSFDDREIVLDTEMGMLTVRGEDLRITQLDLEQGKFAVEGLINAIEYSEGRGGQKARSLIDRLLR